MEHNRDCDTNEEVYGNSNLLTSYSMPTKIDQRIAARVTNTTESLKLIKKHTQIAEFSVVAPDQSKHIQTIDIAILSMIPQADSDLTADLNKPAELLRANKPEHQNNTF